MIELPGYFRIKFLHEAQTQDVRLVRYLQFSDRSPLYFQGEDKAVYNADAIAWMKPIKDPHG